jgi:polysaccharide pyruvyl transferase WcaK-like protein
MSELNYLPMNRNKKCIPVALFGEAPTTGDEAIAIGLLKALTAEIPSLSLTIYTEYPELYHTIKDSGAFVRKMSLPIDNNNKICRYLFVLSLFSGISKFWERHPIAQKSKYISTHYQAVFLQGGPGWAPSLLISPRLLLAKFLFLKSLKKYKCPVFSIGQSLGPWPKIQYIKMIICKILLEQAISCIAITAPRDKASFNLAKQFNARILAGVDTAIGMQKCRSLKAKIGNRQRIGICVRDFQEYYGHGNIMRSIILELSHLVDRLETLNYEIIWIATDYRKNQDKLNDLEVINEVMQRCKIYKSNRLLNQVKPMHPQEIIDISASLDLLVSFRLHPVILSSLNSLPAISISYDSKCSQFMESIGLQDYILDLGDFSSDSVFELISKLESNLDGIRSDVFRAISKQQDVLQGIVSEVAERIYK